MNFYDYYRGQEFEAFGYLGAHFEGDEVVLRTFAPAARAISVIGEWDGWAEQPMARVYDGNFWELRVPAAPAGEAHAPGARAGHMYKFRIEGQDGRTVDHADPYAFAAELRPGTASVLYDPDGPAAHEWGDAAWQRARHDPDHEPVNVYEVQAGSWRLPDPSDPERHYTYRELADLLVPYLRDMRYTHLELMPVTEYPSDESWGYQTTGFFAPTSRYGSPDDLKYLVDACHASGIGVILDFVAVHFAANDYGLLRYDGTALYEYPSSDVGRSEWGTCNFMHSRPEVRSFLQSSVWFWLSEYHFDGVRVDAVSNLIYWQGNDGRGVNASAVQFLQTMNKGIKARRPDALLIAEDSSSYPGVTHPVGEGGLGFDYKWDLGWMNDTLSYLKGPAYGRKDDYHRLTFSIMYYYNERYLLPLSHDEVVHGKASLVQKMDGADEAGKLAQARMLLTYQYAHPGKVLNFMGNELGGPYEYSEKKEIDWWVLRDFEANREFHDFVHELNGAYAAAPALWAADYERDGFEWADCGNEGRSAVYAFVRRGGGQTVLAVLNFDRAEVAGYEVALPARDLPAPAAGDAAAPGKKDDAAPAADDPSATAEEKDAAGLVAVRLLGTMGEPVGEELPLTGGVLALDLAPFSAQLLELRERA